MRFQINFIRDSEVCHASRRVLMPHAVAGSNSSEEHSMTSQPKVWTTLIAVVVATYTPGCASTTPRCAAPKTDCDAGTGDDVITMSEFARLDPGLSVIEAVERVRPLFLRPHGAVPTVSIDGSAAMDLSDLRMIRVIDVREVRLVRGMGRSGHATIRSDGSVVVGDVLLVLTKGRRG
jgi:hypothetical protein